MKYRLIGWALGLVISMALAVLITILFKLNGVAAFAVGLLLGFPLPMAGFYYGGYFNKGNYDND